MKKILFGQFLTGIILIVYSSSVEAAPKAVFTDPETGYEIWQMTNGSQFEGPDYYTTPLFSPNGKYFIYHDSAAYPTYISIMNSDGTNRRNMGNFTGESSSGAFGWWSNDSKYYYSASGLYRINAETALSEQLPNAAGCLPFYYPMVSPDGKVLSGVANSGDTTSRGILKLINTDGTNCKTITAPVQPSGTGFDVTHGWAGNNAVWYLNNSVNSQYRDIMRVVDPITGTYLGSLDAVDPDGSDSWNGIFDHPQVSHEGYMVGGSTGMVAGYGSSEHITAGWGKANTLLVNSPSDVLRKELASVVDAGLYPAFSEPMGPQQNFSPNGKWLITYNVRGNCSTLAVFPVDKASSPQWLAAFGPSSLCEMPSGFGSYATFSPDSTKVIFGSQYELPNRNSPKSSGKPDIYIVVWQKPEKQTNFKAINTAGNVALSWIPALSHHEIKEYQIFWSNTQNGSYELLSAVPEKYTYLQNDSKLGVSDTSITVDDTSPFPDSGVIEIAGLSNERPSELVAYTGKTANTLTGCSRGYAGSQPAEHYHDAVVWLSTQYHGFTDSNITGSRWYKIKSVEWSGLESEFSASITFSSVSPTPACPGDLNNDRVVNLADLSLAISNWGKTGIGDLNVDGVVNLADIANILAKWGNCP